MVVGGLAKVARAARHLQTTSRAHHPMRAARPNHVPAGHVNNVYELRPKNNFEPDPLDVVEAAVALGEAGPAVLFLYPMWAAASAYLKDPKHYQNKPVRHCGDETQQEKRRPLEWAPFKRFVPTHHDYRNPRLTDAERQKLVEWMQPAKTRGNFTGAEGLPKGLPQDPKRDDSFTAPIDLRNMAMDVPKGDALPPTERTLPHLQQDDVQRRLTMGDSIPGRERSIGDFSGSTPNEKSARDFLTASEKPASENVPVSRVPDIRMQRGRKASGENSDKSPNGPFARALLEYGLRKRNLAGKLRGILGGLEKALEQRDTPEARRDLGRVRQIAYHIAQDEDWLDVAFESIGLSAMRKIDWQPLEWKMLQKLRDQLIRNIVDPREQAMGLAPRFNKEGATFAIVISDLAALLTMMKTHATLGRQTIRPTVIKWWEGKSASIAVAFADHRKIMAVAKLHKSQAGNEFEPNAHKEKKREAFVPGRVSPSPKKTFRYSQKKPFGPKPVAKAGVGTMTMTDHHARADGSVQSPWASDVTDARGVGLQRDHNGTLTFRAHADVKSNPTMARMSDGPQTSWKRQFAVVAVNVFSGISVGETVSTGDGLFSRLGDSLGYYKSNDGKVEGFQLNFPEGDKVVPRFIPISALRRVTRHGRPLLVMGGPESLHLEPVVVAPPLVATTQINVHVPGSLVTQSIPWAAGWDEHSPQDWVPQRDSPYHGLAPGGWDMKAFLHQRDLYRAGLHLLKMMEGRDGESIPEGPIQETYVLGLPLIAGILMDSKMDVETASRIVQLFVFEEEAAIRLLAKELVVLGRKVGAQGIGSPNYHDKVRQMVRDLHLVFPILQNRNLWLWERGDD